MAVAETFLAVSVTLLFGKMTSGELLKYARIQSIDSQLAKEMEQDNANDPGSSVSVMKAWLNDLQDLTYDLKEQILFCF